MTKTVARDEILDFVTYEERRAALRGDVMRTKAARRVHVGPHLTLLFENHDTIRYQVLEMVRTERMVKPDKVGEAARIFEALAGVEVNIDMVVQNISAAATGLTDISFTLPRADGQKAYARFDARQVGETRVSSVQYLKFEVGEHAPVAIGCDHPDPELRHETLLTREQREALQHDLDE